jgi:cell division protein FtsB
MSEKKMVGRNVAMALGIVCIILMALIAYFTVTGISAQNSYNNLQDQNKQLQTWLDENETLLTQTQANNTNLQDQMDNLTSILNLKKSSVWYNGTLEINHLPLEPTMLYENAPYAGSVSVYASSLPTSETVVVLSFYSEAVDVRHQEMVNVGSNGTAVFPVLPDPSMSIYFAGLDLVFNTSRTADVIITYYY